MTKKNLTPKEKEIQKAVNLAIKYMDSNSMTPEIQGEIDRVKAKYGLKNFKKFFYLNTII